MRPMADCVQNSETKNAVRELAYPIADVVGGNLSNKITGLCVLITVHS